MSEEAIRNNKITIIKGAMDMINEKGIQSLSARALGSRIGMNSALIYRYFKDIDEVILYACVNALQEYTADMVTSSQILNDADDSYDSDIFMLSWEIFCSFTLSSLGAALRRTTTKPKNSRQAAAIPARIFCNLFNFYPPFEMVRAVNDAAMALHAIGPGVQAFSRSRMDIFHGVFMAPQTVAVHGLTGPFRQLDAGRIIPDYRMIGVHHPGAPLLHHVDRHIVMGQMAFRAILSAVAGFGKGCRLPLHGMTGAAKCRRAGEGHHPRADGTDQQANGKSARQAAQGMLRKKFFELHFRSPPLNSALIISLF